MLNELLDEYSDFKLDKNSSKTTLEQYTEWYRAQPLLWRICNFIWWRTVNVWSALTGKLNPNEIRVAKILAKEIEKNKTLEEKVKTLHELQKKVF